MSFLRHLRKYLHIVIRGPAVPAHLVIQFVNGHIHIVEVRPQHLSRSSSGVAQFVLPAFQPCHFQLPAGQIRQGVFHVFGEKYCLGQEVTLRCRMTPSLASVADNGWIKLPSVVIWAGIPSARVAGTGGIAWASRCTAGISIVANALASEVPPMAIHIHSKHRRGRALN